MVFSSRIVQPTFTSPPRELTDAYRYLDHFSSLRFVKTIAKLNF